MKTYLVLGHRVTLLPTIGDYSMAQIISSPGVPGPPPHFHEDVSEFFYVADGALDVMVDGEWRTLKTGESLCLDPGQTHTLTNNSDRDVRWITGWSPRGFEKFFEDFGVDAETAGAFEMSVADSVIGEVVERCSGYGMILAAAEERS